MKGVTGVPFTIIDGKWAVSGGQTAPVFVKVRDLFLCSAFLTEGSWVRILDFHQTRTNVRLSQDPITRVGRGNAHRQPVRGLFVSSPITYYFTCPVFLHSSYIMSPHLLATPFAPSGSVSLPCGRSRLYSSLSPSSVTQRVTFFVGCRSRSMMYFCVCPASRIERAHVRSACVMECWIVILPTPVQVCTGRLVGAFRSRQPVASPAYSAA